MAALKYYPNPTSGTLHIEGLEDIAGANEVKVYNTAGELLQRTNASSIDLSVYPNGIYLLQAGGKTVRVLKE